MASIDSLMAELDDSYIARKVASIHDVTKNDYHLPSIYAEDFYDFSRISGDYYNFHFSRCFSDGGRLSRSDAEARAKAIIGQEYRRRGRTIASAFNDAQEDAGLGGMRLIIDIIAGELKAEAIENWVRDAFDRHIAPTSWDQKVDMIRQFFARYGHVLSSSIRPDQPESYAENYEVLIREYLKGLRQISSLFKQH